MEIKPVLLDKIDLGCGLIRKQGFLRVDHNAEVNPDLCFDLEVAPWPLPSDHFTEINCCHVIEHLTDTKIFLSEVVRISKDGAKFRFEFPHYSVSFIEPDHRRGYGLHALGLFKQFKVENVRLEWSPKREGKSPVYYAVDKIITWLANRDPYVCERVWCYWVGGFSNVVLEGRVLKDGSVFKELLNGVVEASSAGVQTLSVEGVGRVKFYSLEGDDQINASVQILSLWVEPEMRRNGHGSHLIEKVVERGWMNGATYVSVRVSQENRALQSFLLKNGFKMRPEKILFTKSTRTFQGKAKVAANRMLRKVK